MQRERTIGSRSEVEGSQVSTCYHAIPDGTAGGESDAIWNATNQAWVCGGCGATIGCQIQAVESGGWDEAQAWADEAVRNGDPELAAPRAEGLDVERLAEATWNVNKRDWEEKGGEWPKSFAGERNPEVWRIEAEAIAAEYDRLGKADAK